MAVISWSMEYYFGTLYGGLTRLGSFSERNFGWQSGQLGANSPEYLKDYPGFIIPKEHFKDYPLTEADVLVIGDSFSKERIWQTKLIAEGLKVSTLTWKDLRPADSLPGNLGDILRASGFKGRYLVIESVEMAFLWRVQSLAKEHHETVKQDVIINSALRFYPFPQREAIVLNKLNGGEWGIKTLYNEMKLALNPPDSYLQSGLALAVRFDGCQVFTNKRCDYGLFFKDEFTMKAFNVIANVQTINKNLQQVNIQPIWLIVPDKSTVYLGFGKLNKYPYVNIWEEFANYPELIAPNLAAAFIKESRNVKDFYLPNDLHLSSIGYLYLGELMKNGLRNIKAKNPKPFS